MNIYSRKQQWKWLLLIAALIIVGVSLSYSSQLVQKIAESEKRNVELWAEAVRRKALMMEATSELYTKIAREERKKVELWAEANRLLAQVDDSSPALGFVFQVIRENETVPVILTDSKGKILLSRNLDSTASGKSEYLLEQLELMRQQHDSIRIEISPGVQHYLFYKDSEVFEDIRKSFEDNERSFIKEVASNPASAPAIYTDSLSSVILAYGNLDAAQIRLDSANYLKTMFQTLREKGDTINVTLAAGRNNVIYYMESPQLQQLRYFPVFQFVVIGMFLVVAYLMFSTSRRAEQNLVWVGMAKETAHQLGTPLSSLIAWVEYLKMKGVEESMLKEMSRDIQRLEMITERFSKIGSQPKLTSENMVEVLATAIEYMRARTPKTVEIEYAGAGVKMASVNVALFGWVIENIMRNAVDAMDGKGKITIDVFDQQQFVYIDINDNGKGIPRSKQKTIFEPGFTTKQRGWGLGLSLCKRIIEQYHDGKIFVKSSEPNNGTTFRIVLKS
jgi:two-component system, sporulation sensor kinase D